MGTEMSYYRSVSVPAHFREDFMEPAQVESMLKNLEEELDAKSKRLEAAELEVTVLLAERDRLQGAVAALKELLEPPPDPEKEGLALTDAILLAARPGRLPRAALAAHVAKTVQSKSRDPERVAAVRIAQLIKEKRLQEINGIVRPLAPPNTRPYPSASK